MSVTEHDAAAIAPGRAPDGGPRRSAPPGRRLARAREYAPLARTSFHVRFTLANLLLRAVPDFLSGPVRPHVYRWAGFDIGEGAFLMGNLHLTSAAPGFYDKLRVGAGTTIADDVTINLDDTVTIGRDVGIAPGVRIYTGGHRIGPGSHRLGRFIAAPVAIEDGAWVRLGATIVPGVTVGRGAIVAAGAVVLHDVPPNAYAEGNPARVIRRLGWANR
jgi:maltose O-acetyltransferase